MERATTDEMNIHEIFLRLNLIYSAAGGIIEWVVRSKGRNWRFLFIYLFFLFLFNSTIANDSIPYTIIQLIRRRIDKRIAPIIGNNRGLIGLAPTFLVKQSSPR